MAAKMWKVMVGSTRHALLVPNPPKRDERNTPGIPSQMTVDEELGNCEMLESITVKYQENSTHPDSTSSSKQWPESRLKHFCADFTEPTSHEDKVAPEDEREAQLDELQMRLEMLNRAPEDCLEIYKDAQQAFAMQDGCIRLLKAMVAKQNRHIMDLLDTELHLKCELAELADSITEHKLSINKLTETISNSAHNVVVTTRDDDYFEGEFAKLAGATHQWVFRYFRGGPDIYHQDLPQTVQESLKATIFQYETAPNIKINLREIEMMLNERLHSQIFLSNFIFRIYGLDRPHIRSLLGGTDHEKQNWNTQMVDMLIKNVCFDEYLQRGVNDVVWDIQGSFSSLAAAKVKDQGKCWKALNAIVEQAARLEVEIRRQISAFELLRIEVGSTYSTWYMEDISGAVDDAEEKNEGTGDFIVQMVLFPAVARWGFDNTGRFTFPGVIVRKARVIAAHTGMWVTAD